MDSEIKKTEKQLAKNADQLLEKLNDPKTKPEDIADLRAEYESARDKHMNYVAENF